MPSRFSAADWTVFRNCALFVGQRRVEGQFGHAEDGIHRRADLVADVGEELVLGTIAGLRRLFGLSQLAFQPLAVRNVLNDLDAVGGLSRRIELERDGQVRPDRRTVLADETLFHGVAC